MTWLWLVVLDAVMPAQANSRKQLIPRIIALIRVVFWLVDIHDPLHGFPQRIMQGVVYVCPRAGGLWGVGSS